MELSTDKKVAELDRLVRNLSKRIKDLERDNRLLRDITPLTDTAVLADVVLTVNKVTNSLKRAR